MITDPRLITRNGVDALRRGDWIAARAAFDRLEKTGQGSHQIRLWLAQACAMSGDAAAAHRALDKVIAEEPTNLYAMVIRGDLLAGAGDRRAAVAWYEAALVQAPRAGALPPDLVGHLRRIEGFLAESNAGFGTQIEAQFARAGIDPAAAGPRFAEAMEILAGRAQPQLQRPTNFYFPGLAQRSFFDPAEFGWAAAIETVAPAIRAELEAVLADGAGLEPYVAAEADRPAKQHPLLGRSEWSAFHLFRQGTPVAANAARCPATMAALGRAPIPRIAGRSPMALFSVLRPGTHIPPHHGMLNTRLICHLPLIVPPGCTLRVGNQTREVVADRLMIFDDSIEHEAWNRSEATRVILLFEVWRPELDAAERAALTALYEATGGAEDQAGA